MAKGNGKRTEAGGSLPRQVDAVVWVFFTVAVLASLFVLLRGPEEGGAAVSHTVVQVRLLAVAASVLGAACGLWRVLLHGGEEDLLAMAVLFNLILGCFWVLRIAFAGPAVPAP
jgi:hypothetical protein